MNKGLLLTICAVLCAVLQGHRELPHPAAAVAGRRPESCGEVRTQADRGARGSMSLEVDLVLGITP